MINVGLYDTLEDAKQARQIKENQAFGVFVNKIELIKQLIHEKKINS